MGRAEEAYDLIGRSLAVNPNNPVAYNFLGYVYRYVGLLDESVRAFANQKKLDSSPANSITTLRQLRKVLIYKSDFRGALRATSELHEIASAVGDPLTTQTLFYSGMAYYFAGDIQRANAYFDSCQRLDPRNTFSLFAQACKEGAHGSVTHLKSIIRTLEQQNIPDVEMTYRFVHFYVFANEPEKAVKQLTQVVLGGFYCYPYVANDPLLASLKGRPGFDEAVAKAKVLNEGFRRNHANIL